MEQRSFLKALRGILLVLAIAGCASKPEVVTPPPAAVTSGVSDDQLDAAVREISDYLNKQLPKGNKLVILNIQSEYPALSEYIIDELIANTVNDRVFTVVDRQQLDVIRGELDFQTSGEVDDDTAQALGQMAGAQIIVSGAVSKIGDLYRLRVRALGVQTAQIEGQFNRNIPDGPTVAALVRSQATGYGDSGGRPAAKAAAQPAKAAAPAPAPVTVTPQVLQVPTTPARPGTVYNGNGHSYEVVNMTMSWTDARRYCEERGGYLATITDSGEQTFIENLLAREGNKRFYWLGGYIGSDRRFQWLTGERFEYTNWMPGEPSGGGEDKLEILRVAHPLIKDSRLGHWNDAFNESNKNSDYTSELGIICEFDT